MRDKRQPKRYATRGEEPRGTFSVVLPVRLIEFIRSQAKVNNESISLAAENVIERGVRAMTARPRRKAS